MNKKKKNTQPPRKKKGAKRTGAPRNKLAPLSLSKQSLMPLAHQVCGISDPFCVHANGSKYPDASSVRTLPYTSRQRFILSTTPAGEIAALFSPSYSYSPYTAATAGVLPNVTAWANFAAFAPIAGVSSYRITSVGMKISMIASKFTASGLLSLRSYGNETISALAAVDLTTFNASSYLDIPIPDIKQVVAVHPHTTAMPQTLYSVAGDTSNISTAVPRGYQPITLYVSGAPASAGLLNVEYIINYELAFEDNTGLAQLATPTVTGGTVLATAAAAVTSKLPTFVEKGVSYLGDWVLKKAMTAVAARLGGPAGVAAYKAIEVD